MLCYDFREGYSEILELLNWEDIPLLVFSAGVGDVIEQCFVQRYKLHKNIHIIANWMSFSHEVYPNSQAHLFFGQYMSSPYGSILLSNISQSVIQYS